ncbi:MAG: SNF2-related protein, partial [Planctomycetes bacterium]|nr:SNF2-related protein [Planctomycetota bacterium]
MRAYDDSAQECLEICITPSGYVSVSTILTAEEWTWPAPAGTWRDEPDIAEALVLELAAAGSEVVLAPAWRFWREFAILYITALCHIPEDTNNSNPPPVDGERFAALAASAPPMPGGEYLSADVLARFWDRLDARMREEALEAPDGIAGWLRARNPAWRMVGKVCFHLAENKKNLDLPFAFLATYAPRLSNRGTAQHAPLANALREFAGEKNKDALLKLLSPVQLAAEASPLAQELVDSGQVFHPQGWTPQKAYRFLKDIPAFEAAGLMVRVPDWWSRRPRPAVKASIGKSKSGGVGKDAMLSFDVSLSLGGETLSEEDFDRILSGQNGLVFLKGQWVEVDKDRLRQALEHWRKVKSRFGTDGMSFLEGMRMLAGGGLADAGAAEEESAAVRDWSEVAADGWFKEILEKLRSPEADATRPTLPTGLMTELRPYQETGVKWLSFLSELGLGACLADDMGLGKTVQILSLLLLEKERNGRRKPSLIVLPASLLGNWRSELERF